MIFSTSELLLVALIFIWSGFVRTGLGFGGAALGLPLLLLVNSTPLYWLPIVGLHLLAFAAITLVKSYANVDWIYLRKSLIWIIPAALIGVTGLLNLPNIVIVIFVYTVTIFYALTWIFNATIASNKPAMDKLLLIIGGYITGTSLTGAPLIVTVFMRYVSKNQLRDTLFMLWFILVGIKMLTFITVGTYIDWQFTAVLLPVAGIGHIIGLKLHRRILNSDKLLKKVMGTALLIISSFGLLQTLTH